MMKKLKMLFLLMVLAAGLSLGGAGVTIATAAMAGDEDTKWSFTDGDSNYLDFGTFFEMPIQENFYLTDVNQTDQLLVLQPGAKNSIIHISENDSDGNWYAGYSEDDFNLNLGKSGYFLYQYGNSFTYEYEVSGTNQYFLTFGDGAKVQATDVSPVPIPSAALLLASGILGLGWLKRRSA